MAPLFEDVATASGIAFQFHADIIPDRYFLPEIMGGGVAWLDFDRDGILDLYLVNGRPLDGDGTGPLPLDQAYRGDRSGRFQAIPTQFLDAPSQYGQGCAAGDFNADGFPDLYIAAFGENLLLLNNGDGTFQNITQPAGVADSSWSTSVLWLDIDGDRLLDLYVTNYLDVALETRKICEYGGQPGYCGPGQYEAVQDRVFLNQGDGTFREAAVELGFLDPNGKGLAIAAIDFDNDLVPEIYVANDMTSNQLFVKAPGPPTSYRDVAPASGAAQSGEGMNEASMGISAADFDNDGLIDLFLTHYYHMKNTVYRNCGNLLFDDVSRMIGAARASYDHLGFGTVPLDYDRDGFDDLFIATGHVLGPKVQPSEMTPQLIRNDRGRKFVDISAFAGPHFQAKALARGAAAADYDDDGDIDIAVTYLDRPFALLRNDTRAPGRYLGVRLESADRIAPTGARVRVVAGDRVQTRTLTAGGSYLSWSDERLLFSAPIEAATADVEVVWPSGATERFVGLDVDAYWSLTEGQPPRRQVR